MISDRVLKNTIIGVGILVVFAAGAVYGGINEAHALRAKVKSDNNIQTEINHIFTGIEKCNFKVDNKTKH